MRKVLLWEFAIMVVLLLAAIIICFILAAPLPQAALPQPAPEPTMPTVPAPPAVAVSWMTFPESRQLTAQQYFVYDCDAGALIRCSGSGTDRVYPASITKLFTACVAMQYVDPEEEITVGQELELVAWGSSVANLVQGDVLTGSQLVQAMLLPSGNDAAYVLAAHAGRSILGDPQAAPQQAVEAFMVRMNQCALDRGLTGTHFSNPDGIHQDDHYMTIDDLALLGRLSLENETVLECAAIPRETVTPVAGDSKNWKNTNKLMDPASDYFCPYALGLKTGQTPMAGSCLLSAFQLEGRTLIIGVFGCPESADRFMDTLQLFNETMGIV